VFSVFQDHQQLHTFGSHFEFFSRYNVMTHLATDSVIQVADLTPLSTIYVMFRLFFTRYINISIIIIGLLNCHHIWSSNVVAWTVFTWWH